jgi:hypothetical protein
MTLPIIKLAIVYGSNYDVIPWSSSLEQLINIEVIVVTPVFGQIYIMSCGRQLKG